MLLLNALYVYFAAKSFEFMSCVPTPHGERLQFNLAIECSPPPYKDPNYATIVGVGTFGLFGYFIGILLLMWLGIFLKSNHAFRFLFLVYHYKDGDEKKKQRDRKKGKFSPSIGCNKWNCDYMGCYHDKGKGKSSSERGYSGKLFGNFTYS